MSNCKEYKIKDLGLVVTGKTPSSKFPDDFGNEMPFVTPTDYKNFRKWTAFAERSLSEKGIEKLRNKILSPSSVLVTCIGSDMGKVVMNKVPVITNQQVNSIIPNQELVFPDFLYYKLVDSYETLRMHGQAGTAVPIVNKGDFEEISLVVPNDLEEQKSIASILSSLDDKIDLLHRQNQTLEALAETLFRQWFVEENESLEIAKLKDFCNHLKANVNPLKQPDKIFHHYSIPAFDEGQEPEIALGKEIRSNKYQVREGTLLISKLNPRFPRIWPILEKVDENHSICSTEFQVIKPKDTGYFGFIFCFLKSKTVKDELIQSTGGTSGSHQRVSPEDIFNLTLKCPSFNKLEKFNCVTNDYWKKINQNKNQVRTLTRLRDTLLPKLMSGEVSVV